MPRCISQKSCIPLKTEKQLINLEYLISTTFWMSTNWKNQWPIRSKALGLWTRLDSTRSNLGKIYQWSPFTLYYTGSHPLLAEQISRIGRATTPDGPCGMGREYVKWDWQIQTSFFIISSYFYFNLYYFLSIVRRKPN